MAGSKVPCPFCGASVTDTILELHKGNCPKRPAQSPVVAPSVVVPPVVPQVIIPPAAPQPPEVNQVGYEILRSGDHSEPTPVVEAALEASASPAAHTSEENILFYPTINPYFVIPTDLQAKLERAEAISHQHPMKLLLTGPKGAGKTSLGKQFAAKYNRPCFIAPCMTMTEGMQWWGKQEVSPERGTFYVPSAFVKAVETPNCVILLDDMNRTDNPKVLNPLFKLLDDELAVFLDDLGRYVRVAEGVVFIATVNEGFEYQGVDPIDLALRSRFANGVILIDYPPALQIREIILRRTGVSVESADILSRFAGSLAGHPQEPIFIDMRQMIAMAEDVVFGASIRDAVMFCLLGSLVDEQIEKVNAVLQNLLQDNFTARTPDWRPWL